MAATARALQISIWHISRKSRLPWTKGGTPGVAGAVGRAWMACRSSASADKAASLLLLARVRRRISNETGCVWC